MKNGWKNADELAEAQGVRRKQIYIWNKLGAVERRKAPGPYAPGDFRYQYRMKPDVEEETPVVVVEESKPEVSNGHPPVLPGASNQVIHHAVLITICKLGVEGRLAPKAALKSVLALLEADEEN
jgi:hypothetical protein